MSDQKFQQVLQKHAAGVARSQASRPRLQIPSFNVAEKKSQVSPSTNAFFQQQQQQQQQLQQPQPAMNFEQMTQNLAQQSSMFPNAEQFQYEQQPGPNSLSKWTFSVLSQSLIRKISSANNLFL